MITPSRLSSFPAAIVVALLLVAPMGCAPKKAPVAPEMVTAEAIWENFRTNYCTPGDEPGLLVKASLYYTRTKPTKRTNRTLVSMWGNFGGPMRLDVSAGIGKLLAHMREDERGLTIFYPTENKAFSHSDPILGGARMGMPFPFSLIELGRLSMGDFSGLTPASFIEATPEKDGFRYTIHGALADSITLDTAGRPIILEGTTVKAYESARTWRLEINKYEEDEVNPLPRRLTLQTDAGEKGVLHIKSRELKVTPWPEKSTGLELPEDVMVRRLDARPAPTEKE